LRLLSGTEIIATDLDDGKLKTAHPRTARVRALAESGRLTPIPLEFWPLEKINEVYERVKHGQVAGRTVLTPAS
jgi:D-arabinose 1-dehydrogenase-like Zn-dependent alcohol dehydrogenase